MTDPLGSRKRHAEASRDSRLRLRAWLWDHSSQKRVNGGLMTNLRVTSCGRQRVAERVSLRAGTDVAGLAGVSTCSSVWVCPSCSAKIAATRAAEVAATIQAHRAQGGSVVLATFALRHSRKHPLAESWSATQEGWAAVRNGNGWKADVEAFGIVGYCRVIEVTHGRRNGWHPHAHVLLFLEGDAPDPAALVRLRGRLFARWSSRLQKLGYSTLEVDKDGNAVGVDVRVAHALDDEYVAGYLTKFGYTPKGDPDGGESGWSLSKEISRGDLKRGRKGSRTPWELLEDAMEGDQRARRLWHVYEWVSQGRRQYAWAKGFRESLGLGSVQTDEAAAQGHDERLDAVALFPPATWTALVADIRKMRLRPGMPLLSKIVNVAATETPEAVWAYLDSLGLDYERPGSAERVDVTGLVVAGERPAVAPVVVPGRRHETLNRRDQARREAHAIPAGETRALHPCRICGGELDPSLRDAGVHLGVTDGQGKWLGYSCGPSGEVQRLDLPGS